MFISGFTAGIESNNLDGGTNYLCLSDNPKVKPRDANLGLSKIWGTAYELPDNDALDEVRVPCAVCQVSPPDVVVLMIPGTDTCPDGWNEQYHGDLMSNKEEHKSPSEYVCVTETREGDSAKIEDDDDSNLSPVQSRCDDTHLPCDLYPRHSFLTCVVCSR